MLPKGGSILGTSRTNPFKSVDGANRILKNVSEHDIEAVIAIGGEDTLGVAYKLYEMGSPSSESPKRSTTTWLARTIHLVFKRQWQLLVKHLTGFIQRQNRITG